MRKPVTRCLAVVALLCLGMTTQADAGSRAIRLASAKSCDCVPSSQPDCCRPTIVKPCCPTVHTYQRQISCLKPPCCDGCGAPNRCCRPRHGGRGCNAGCGNTGCCDAAANGCCTDGAGANGCCENGVGCDGLNGCCSSNTPNCEAIRLNNLGNALCCPGDGGCCPSDACGNGCDADGCCDDCCPCYLSPKECCRLAELIYKSQTACYPHQRRSAVRKISNKYDCECTPEVMAALIYALNDSDPRVRQVAADEINDQLRKNCCCSPELTQALTCALGDCAKPVRKSAERALEKCGYDVVEPCCETECCDGCDSCDGCGHGFRHRLKGLLSRHGCGDDCCDTDCCDGGCGKGCGLGCKFRGIFKKHCGIDCCGDDCCDSDCCDGGCGHKCGLFSKLMGKHHGDDCCDTDCCDGGCGLCGKGIGCKLKGIFSKHHGDDCCDGCDGCDGCCAKKGCGLRRLFSKHHGSDCCCDSCCPASCCNTGAQTGAAATYAAPQVMEPTDSAAPVAPDAPAPAPEVAPAPPTEQPAACRPTPKKDLAGLYGQAG